MPYPQGAEYNLAVQHPHTAFGDPHLRACVAETTPLGLPRPYSGGFTTTYRLVHPVHGQAWAVRCFTREIPDLELRYKALQRFFERHSGEPAFVPTWHLPSGIRVAGRWHPVIKMRWIEGQSLDACVRSNLSTPRAIEQLAYVFADLIGRLERIGFVHGDLQHGNILVKAGQLYLIDYDGSSVPEIAALGTNNLGHVNYQHPGRSEATAMTHADRFSAIVIYLGLLGVAAQPSLWREFDTGENILFRRDDFVDAEHSALIARLCRLPSVAHLAERFKRVCRYDPQDVPSLDAFARGEMTAPRSGAPARAMARTPAGTPAGTPWYGRRSQYPVFDCNDRRLLLQYVGKRVEVLGRVVQVIKGQDDARPWQFINLGRAPHPHHSLALVLWKEGLISFREAGRDPHRLLNTWVSVTGVLSVYTVNGRLVPQIIVDNQAQVRPLADGEIEARARLAAYALHPEVNPALTTHDARRWTVEDQPQAQAVFDRLYGSPATPASRSAGAQPDAGRTGPGNPASGGATPWYADHLAASAARPRRVIGADEPTASPAAPVAPLAIVPAAASGRQHPLRRWLTGIARRLLP